jgi:hypothetical protein
LLLGKRANRRNAMKWGREMNFLKGDLRRFIDMQYSARLYPSPKSMKLYIYELYPELLPISMSAFR